MLFRFLLILLIASYCETTNALPVNAKQMEQFYLKHFYSRSIGSNGTIKVNSSRELKNAIELGNKIGDQIISIEPGVYRVQKTINITGSNIKIVGLGDSPFDVRLVGNGMRETRHVDNLLRVAGDNFQLENLTLQDAGNHLVQIAGEVGISGGHYKNVVFKDGYEQLLKVSYNKKTKQKFAKDIVLENCLFLYSKGIGPNWYIGGIDAHGIKGWRIENNVFAFIASPGKHIAEHAIHLWNDTKNNLVTGNWIFDSDRGIGFGMRRKKSKPFHFSNWGGQISNNVIVHRDNGDPYGDVGIIAEDSPETLITNNSILFEHSYFNAIEVRFENSFNVLVENNLSNRRLVNRDGGSGVFTNNERLSSNKVKRKILSKLLSD